MRVQVQAHHHDSISPISTITHSQSSGIRLGRQAYHHFGWKRQKKKSGIKGEEVEGRGKKKENNGGREKNRVRKAERKKNGNNDEERGEKEDF